MLPRHSSSRSGVSLRSSFEARLESAVKKTVQLLTEHRAPQEWAFAQARENALAVDNVESNVYLIVKEG